MKTKKKSKDHPVLRSRPKSNYWGDADAGHGQIIGGGGAVKLLGGYPPSPRVSAPLCLPHGGRFTLPLVIAEHHAGKL